jgi:hypothetical protein
VLSLDADEVVDSDFLINLENLPLNKTSVYQIFRKNFYRQKHIKHCWNNDKIVRLYCRQKTQFNNNKVHEKVLSDGLKIKSLIGFVNHYPYNNISERLTFLYDLEIANVLSVEPLSYTTTSEN